MRSDRRSCDCLFHHPLTGRRSARKSSANRCFFSGFKNRIANPFFGECDIKVGWRRSNYTNFFGSFAGIWNLEDTLWTSYGARSMKCCLLWLPLVAVMALWGFVMAPFVVRIYSKSISSHGLLNGIGVKGALSANFLLKKWPDEEVQRIQTGRVRGLFHVWDEVRYIISELLWSCEQASIPLKCWKTTLEETAEKILHDGLRVIADDTRFGEEEVSLARYAICAQTNNTG